MQEINDNIRRIQAEIAGICSQTGRNPEDITLIAVTKTVDPDRINHAIDCGIGHVGENKVQEVTAKYDFISKKVKWHLIGHLQTNKVKYIIDKVDLIHSLDSQSLAQEINKRAEKAGIVKEVLIQVNVAKEESKFGIDFEDIDSFLYSLAGLSNIRVCGLMTIAPYYEDPELVRPVFKQLKIKFDALSKSDLPNIEMRYLSMGMTNDFTVAIEEGANMVRIGTGIFGKRNYNI